MYFKGFLEKLILPSLVIFTFLTSFSKNLLASPAEINLSSIIKIDSAKTGACGSGIAISENSILTASHVIESMCELNSCRDLVISFGDELKQPATNPITQSFKIISNIPSFDLGIIKFEGDYKLPHYINLWNTQEVQSGKIFSLSFPECKNLEKRTGDIKQTNELQFHTTLESKKGSSGGPVFNQNGALIGVIAEADSLLGALFYQFFGNYFSTKIARINYGLLTLEDLNQSLAIEAESIYNYYWQTVFNQQSYTRIFSSLNFFYLVDRFKKRALLSGFGKEITPLLAQNLFLDSHSFDKSVAQITSLSRKLSILSQYERFGFTKAPLTTLTPEKLKSFIESFAGDNESQKNDLLAIVDRLAQENYPGYDLMLLTLGSSFGLFLLLLLPLWGFTIGYIWKATSGGFWKKLWLCIVVTGLIWPISFFAFLVGERKKRMRELARLKK